ncbi:hypothetical protein CDL15_Pgr025708 [Punica granatum]|uniref:AB hydrolase-1 domain-containing protein n=1 Tax=Punica granatum TaxID=22663 RepID=A0A218WBJ1_PUNGR|nr:hypothetical protein CDL15_Pgr025708 [Punica granatum]
MGEVAEKAEPTTRPQQLHFVLVHGIGGGAWCWYKIRTLMENSSYRVSCIDLKSAGIDSSDSNSIHSFNEYNKPLIDFMSSLPETEQVILVGHSAGGLSLTQATGKFARKIRVAVYVAGTMLRAGFHTEQDVKDGVPDLSEFGDVNEFQFGLGLDKPPTSMIVKKEFQRKIIYQMSPLEPGPILALQTARFTKDNEDVDKVPRVYIGTMHDNVIKPEQQEAMIKKWPPAETYFLDSDHSPFFSSTFSLFGLLVKISASF